MNHTTALHDAGFSRGRLPGWLARMIHAVIDSYDRHITLKELANLDSHMLEDIGLSRGDLNTVTFKRAFESRHKFDLQDLGRC